MKTKALFTLRTVPAIFLKLGYLQGRDCCGHYKPIKLSRRIARMRLLTISQLFLLVILHIDLFSYLLNAHSNPELARKFHDRQHRLD